MFNSAKNSYFGLAAGKGLSEEWSDTSSAPTRGKYLQLKSSTNHSKNSKDKTDRTGLLISQREEKRKEKSIATTHAAGHECYSRNPENQRSRT
jgi:hypothetical protein